MAASRKKKAKKVLCHCIRCSASAVRGTAAAAGPFSAHTYWPRSSLPLRSLLSPSCIPTLHGAAHARTHARIPIRALFGAVSACRYSLCVKDSKQDQGREAAAAAATVPARHARTCQRRARAQAKHVDRPRVCIPPRRATPMSMRAARRSTDDDDGGHGSRRRRRQGQETQEEGGLPGRPAAQWELRVQQGNQSAWRPSPFLPAPWMSCVPWCHFHVYFLTAAGTGQQKTHSARERGRCHRAAQGPTRPAAQGSSSLASPA